MQSVKWEIAERDFFWHRMIELSILPRKHEEKLGNKSYNFFLNILKFSKYLNIF